MNYRILLVDDDPGICKAIGANLKEEGFWVTTAESGDQAFEALSAQTFELVLTDLVMDGVSGIDVLKKAKELNPETIVIILTGYGDLKTAVEALREQADDYLLKPCEFEEISFRIHQSLEKMELRKKILTYEKILPICCVCKKIRLAPGADAPHVERWINIEKYFVDKIKVDVTSTYCPKCARIAEMEIDRLG